MDIANVRRSGGPGPFGDGSRTAVDTAMAIADARRTRATHQAVAGFTGDRRIATRLRGWCRVLTALCGRCDPLRVPGATTAGLSSNAPGAAWPPRGR
jgi:hypothetical protein